MHSSRHSSPGDLQARRQALPALLRRGVRGGPDHLRLARGRCRSAVLLQVVSPGHSVCWCCAGAMCGWPGLCHDSHYAAHTVPAYRGHSFLSLNKDLLETYAACATGQEVVEAQRRWLEQLQASSKEAEAGRSAPPGLARVLRADAAPQARCVQGRGPATATWTPPCCRPASRRTIRRTRAALAS